MNAVQDARELAYHSNRKQGAFFPFLTSFVLYACILFICIFNLLPILVCNYEKCI